MGRLTTTLAAGLIAATAMAGTASAVSLSIDGGTAGFIPRGTEVNDALAPLGFATPLAGFYGSSISLSGPANVTYTLLGWEAGFESAFGVFTAPGRVPLFGNNFGEVTDPGGVPLGVFGTERNAGVPVGKENNYFNPAGIASFSIDNVASGQLEFNFGTLSGSSPGVPLRNRTNPDGSAGLAVGPNFFAALRDGAVYLFFDGNGGGNDDDHDDLVVRVTAVPPVPLPAGIWLFATALGGLGLLGRKRAAA